MKLALYANIVSPHQMPLARELARTVGEDGFRYVYLEESEPGRAALGWSEKLEPWCVKAPDAGDIVETCEVLLSGVRDIGLFERRSARGLATFCMGERFFKPLATFCFAGRVFSVPGRFRLFHPGYRRMARRFARLLARDAKFRYFPIGVYALRDMELICAKFCGDASVAHRKSTLWGYFVAPGRPDLRAAPDPDCPVRALWIGRFLHWKHPDTAIRAVCRLAQDAHGRGGQPPVVLDMHGMGPEECSLRDLASGFEDCVRIMPPLPIASVREAMRAHDVCIVTSDGMEGWNAGASEALEEGMRVVGTFEAGATATILPPEELFHAGDWRTLAALLSKGRIPGPGIGEWTAAKAAECLLSVARI